MAGAGGQEGIAFALYDLGHLARTQGDSATARSFYEQTLTTLEELGHKRIIADIPGDLAEMARDEGDPAAARALNNLKRAAPSQPENQP